MKALKQSYPLTWYCGFHVYRAQLFKRAWFVPNNAIRN